MKTVPPSVVGLPRYFLNHLPVAFVTLAVVGVFALASPLDSANPGDSVVALKPVPTGAVLCSVQPPLEVDLVPLTKLTPGKTAEFRLVVTPKTETSEIRVRSRVAKEIVWLGGQQDFRADAKLDQPNEFYFSVEVPKKGFHPLHIVVEITGTDGRVWRRGVGLGLGPHPHKDKRRIVKGSGNKTYVDYPAVPATQIREESR